MVRASYLRRLMAWMIDAGISALPIWITAPAWIPLWIAHSNQNIFVVHFILALGIIISWLIFQLVALIQALRDLPTLGRRWLRLRIVASEGQTMSMSVRSAWLRAGLGGLIATGIAITVPPILLLDPLWSLVDRKQRSLRDRLARTQIIWIEAATTAVSVPGSAQLTEQSDAIE